MDSGLEIMEWIAAGEQGDGLTRTADLIGTGSDFRLQGDRKQSIHEEYIYSCTESWRYVSLDVFHGLRPAEHSTYSRYGAFCRASRLG